MKTRKKELDVDFIGGTGPLTKEEEKIISEIIKSRKTKSQASLPMNRKKVTAKKKVTR